MFKAHSLLARKVIARWSRGNRAAYNVVETRLNDRTLRCGSWRIVSSISELNSVPYSTYQVGDGINQLKRQLA
jgi:hypothetical protein